MSKPLNDTARMTFREIESLIRELEQEALEKVRQEYPKGVMVILSHGLEERKALVYGYSKYEMKLHVQGKTGKYWVDTHRVLRAVCPNCEREEWSTAGREASYELCRGCGHQWGHR